jgi:hypothetical protein
MAPPPAALEEEWYVSIDREQAGPFSLADAQRWVAQQLFDAELHCPAASTPAIAPLPAHMVARAAIERTLTRAPQRGRRDPGAAERALSERRVSVSQSHPSGSRANTAGRSDRRRATRPRCRRPCCRCP